MTDSIAHTYHLSWPRFLPLIGVWLVVLVLLLLPFAAEPVPDQEDARALLWTALIVTVLLAPAFGMLWQSRLVLTETGITHYQLGYTVRSSWANTQTLCLSRGVESLILRDPGTSSRVLHFSVRALQAVVPTIAGSFGDPEALAQGRLIALAPFMSHWRRGPLRRDLERWAPHLFEAQRPG